MVIASIEDPAVAEQRRTDWIRFESLAGSLKVTRHHDEQLL